MNPGFRKVVFRLGLPVFIVAAGLLAMKLLVMSRKAPEKVKRVRAGVLVRTVRAVPEDCPVVIHATGTVRPSRMVEVVPEVGGRVVAVSPAFVQGGMLRKGQELFRIESVDYELILEKARADLARAELNLQIEKTRADIARKEWRRLGAGKSGSDPPLVLRKPQLKEARAALAAARAAVEQARLNVRRTRLHAPFNAVVKSESIDVGQYVRQGVKVGVLIGTDLSEVVVPVSLEDLGWIRLPGGGKGGGGSRAVVTVDAGERTFAWEGRVVRLLGDVDARSRMSRVIVEVQNPYRCLPGGCNVRLADGLFVNVEFHCGVLRNVFRITRDAVRDNDTVWLMDSHGRLRTRKVHIAHYQHSLAVIDSGLSGGERIVLTTIPGAVDGMKLRTADAQEEM